jgi:hypothetical protein
MYSPGNRVIASIQDENASNSNAPNRRVKRSISFMTPDIESSTVCNEEHAQHVLAEVASVPTRFRPLSRSRNAIQPNHSATDTPKTTAAQFASAYTIR